jgi:hypothetical protein
MPTFTDGTNTAVNDTTATIVMEANEGRLYWYLYNPTVAEGGTGATYRVAFGKAAVKAQGQRLKPGGEMYERIEKERIGDEEDGSQQYISVIADSGGAGQSVDWAKQTR